MKYFLIRVVAITFVFFGLVLSLTVLLTFLENRDLNFVLEGNPEYIVVGHSHPESAFNDSLIPAFKNIAQSGEAYFYNYFKTREVIKQNPSIQVVFIEYTNNQITAEMDKWTWGSKYMSYRYPLYSSFMSNADKFLLLRHNPVDYVKTISPAVEKKLGRILSRNLTFTDVHGGYVFINEAKVDSLIANANPPAKQKLTQDLGLSETNLTYLSHLIGFCEDQGKRVILIRSPLHPLYKGYSNEEKYKEVLASRYPNVTYMDFSKLRFPNSEYRDFEHLNGKGSVFFSKWFAKLLEDGVLDRGNRQEYIDSVDRF